MLNDTINANKWKLSSWNLWIEQLHMICGYFPQKNEIRFATEEFSLFSALYAIRNQFKFIMNHDYKAVIIMEKYFQCMH